MEEYLEAVRLAAQNVSHLQLEKARMKSRACFSGRGDGVGGSGYLDPMRNVDDYIDWEINAEKALREDLSVLEEGTRVLNAIEALNGYKVSQILRERYLNDIAWQQIATNNGLTVRQMDKLKRKVFEHLDQIGLARLKDIARCSEGDSNL